MYFYFCCHIVNITSVRYGGGQREQVPTHFPQQKDWLFWKTEVFLKVYILLFSILKRLLFLMMDTCTSLREAVSKMPLTELKEGAINAGRSWGMEWPSWPFSLATDGWQLIKLIQLQQWTNTTTGRTSEIPNIHFYSCIFNVNFFFLLRAAYLV